MEVLDRALSSMEREAYGSSQPITSAAPPSRSLELPEPLEQYKAKILRKEVYRLKLRVIRKGPDMNDHKKGYMELLRAYVKGNAQPEADAPTTTTTTSTQTIQ